MPRLAWFDRAGTIQGTIGDAARYSDLELSPDGKRATVNVVDPTQNTRDIWVIDLARGLRSRFTFDPSDELASVWSPDASRIVFNSRRQGQFDLYQRGSAGADAEQPLFADDADKYPTDWSADGRFLLYMRLSRETGNDVWVLPMTGADRKPIPFLTTKFHEGSGRFSPDGTLVAYSSTESGRTEVYLVTFPEKNGKWQVSAAGGGSPRWSADGREIFFRDTAGRLAVAAVTRNGSDVSVGDVQPLFPLLDGGLRQFYDVAPDGKRVIANSAPPPDAAAAARPLNVIVNWPASVRK
jgi:Tol biopolymer transport system component